jgi:hypothetical protein
MLNPFKKKESYSFEDSSLDSLNDLKENDNLSKIGIDNNENEKSMENLENSVSDVDTSNFQKSEDLIPASSFNNFEAPKKTIEDSDNSKVIENVEMDTLKVQLDRIEKKLNFFNENFKTIDYNIQVLHKMIESEVSLETKKRIKFNFINK